MQKLDRFKKSTTFKIMIVKHKRCATVAPEYLFLVMLFVKGYYILKILIFRFLLIVRYSSTKKFFHVLIFKNIINIF